jgi:hypothetical protein
LNPTILKKSKKQVDPKKGKYFFYLMTFLKPVEKNVQREGLKQKKTTEKTLLQLKERTSIIG